jgi:hypothetical protein
MWCQRRPSVLLYGQPPCELPTVRSDLLLASAVILVAACGPKSSGTATAPTPTRPQAARAQRETVTVRDPELERRVGRLELSLIEKEAQVAELETRVEDARDEVVRTMAKLQTVASRAEAASGVAEADVALQALRNTPGSGQIPELAQATKLLAQSSAEFNKQNFGGAIYLATQSKTLAASGRNRLSGGNRGPSRAGETHFALPVRLKVSSRGNVREGPGTNFPVVFSVESGAMLTGFSYTDEWVRVTDDGNRGGWIFRPLITRP